MKRDNNNIDDHPDSASTSNESLPTANKVPITPPSDDLNINKFESASRSTLKSLLPAFQSSPLNEIDAASAIDTTESHQSEGHEIEVVSLDVCVMFDARHILTFNFRRSIQMTCLPMKDYKIQNGLCQEEQPRHQRDI